MTAGRVESSCSTVPHNLTGKFVNMHWNLFHTAPLAKLVPADMIALEAKYIIPGACLVALYNRTRVATSSSYIW